MPGQQGVDRPPSDTEWFEAFHFAWVSAVALGVLWFMRASRRGQERAAPLWPYRRRVVGVEPRTRERTDLTRVGPPPG